MTRIFTIILTLLCFSSFSQKRNSIWCFGDSAGIDFNYLSSPQPIFTSADTRGTCVSIADSVGNLLFYGKTGRNGGGVYTGQIYDRNNQLMLNGDSIFGDAWYHEFIIIPYPNRQSTYYLFTTDVTMHQVFAYSVVDMNANGGLGAIIQKNSILDCCTYYYDAMAAVKHGNGRDWWLISKRSDPFSNGDNIFQIYLVTPDSIYHTFQNIGDSCNGNLANMLFSKNGDKFLLTSYRGLIETMDFDRCSGTFSNPTVIAHENFNTRRYWGSAFSRNGHIVYVSVSDITSYLLQFNLDASDIWNSHDTIATFNYPEIACGALRLAPDDKIYLSNAFYDGLNFNYPYPDSVRNMYNENLSVINSPDSLGAPCNFTAYSFYLGGKRTYWGLPNNPDYDMGPLKGSPCDTILNQVASPLTPLQRRGEAEISFYPNPSSGHFYLQNNTGKAIEKIEVFNYLGEIVFSPFQKREEQEMDLSSFPAGIYFYCVSMKDGGVFRGKIVKE